MVSVLICLFAFFLAFGVGILISHVETKKEIEKDIQRRKEKPKRCVKCKRKTFYTRKWGNKNIHCELHLDANGICKYCCGNGDANKWDNYEYKRRNR